MIAGVILAAGTSSRLGRPKQLLELGGKIVTQHVVDAAAASSLDEVVVVLGHEAERVRSALRLPPGFRVVVNPRYEEGQSTSLRAGIDAVEGADAAVILVGDQPGISAELIDRVIEAHRRQGAPMVRAFYVGTPGHPVLVDRSEWAVLRRARGDAGAGPLLDSLGERVFNVEMGMDPPVDVDTGEDYERLRRTTRVGAVAFDVIGTLFSLDRLRAELVERGAGEHALDVWFAGALRDYFSISHSGSYAPLAAVLEATLGRVYGGEPGPVMAAFRELDPAPGAEDALGTLAATGRTLLTLTNGSEDLTRSLLRRAGLDRFFSALLSCDSIRVSKPHPDVYRMAVDAGRGGEVWLVAGHGWDIAGASRAGLRTAWIGSPQDVYPVVFPPPDVRAPDLPSAASAIAAGG